MKLIFISLILNLISLFININGVGGKRGRDITEKGSNCFRDLNCFICCIQDLPPSDLLLDLSPISWKIPLPQKFEGPLKENTILENAKILFQNQLIGPESLDFGPNGDIYTGSNDGTIFRISNDKLSVFANLDGARPLGVRYHRNGYLYVLSDVGLFQIFMNQTVVKVFGIEDIIFSNINDKSSKFIDDLTIIYGEGTNGGDVIYFSDVSTKFNLYQFIYLLLEPDSTGRIIKYDINAKSFTIIMENLWFPNGVKVNDAKNALLINEYTKRRILKHYIKGPNKGNTEVITSELPGEPDNIRRSLSSDETYWVALTFVRNASNPLINDRLSEEPVTRKLLLRTLYLMGSILSYVGSLVNFSPLIEVGDQLLSGQILIPISQLRGMAIEIDSKGTIHRSLQSSNSNFLSISEIREVKNQNNDRVLYFGTSFNPYLGKCILTDGKCINT